MQFGNVVASHVQSGTNAVFGPGADVAHYLCDGLSRPNPGPTKMVVHNGSEFIELRQPARAVESRLRELMEEHDEFQ